MKLRQPLLSAVQKVLFCLAVIASLLLVIDVAAPWVTAQLLAPFKTGLQALPEIELNIIAYIILQIVTVVGLLLFVKFFSAKITELGVGKMKRWHLLLLTPLIAVGYYALTVATSAVLTILFPGYNSGEKQEIGLVPDGSHNLYLTVIYLCILVPLAEEFAFRGYLFGLLRKKLSFVTVAIVTGLLFAVLHMIFDAGTNGGLVIKQLNVAVDVFVLSLFLSYLRERTDSIWAGVALHGLKNFIAFLYIFVYNIG